jgi:hypothetical protein
MLAGTAKTGVTLRFLDMELRDGAAENLRSALQGAIDQVAPGGCDAIVIGYGLYSRGIIGLQARSPAAAAGERRVEQPRISDTETRWTSWPAR